MGRNSAEEDASMLKAAIEVIRRRAPTLREFMKRVFRYSKLPALKLLNGKFTLAAPDLFSVAPTEPHVLKWIAELLRHGEIFFDGGAP